MYFRVEMTISGTAAYQFSEIEKFLYYESCVWKIFSTVISILLTA